MKRYIVKNGELFWAKERLPYHWTPVLKDARPYNSPGGAKQLINQLPVGYLDLQVLPMCVDRLGRVRRLKA